MRELALMEGVDRWFFVSIWNHESHCPPDEDVIDRALKQVELTDAQAVDECSKDDESGGHGSEAVDEEDEV